jgi:hypothetical protein
MRCWSPTITRDHNYDLGSVDDLRYQLHTRWKTLPPKKKRKFDVSQCLFVMDEDTAKVFSQNRAEHRGSPIHFSAASHERHWWIKKANGLPVTVEHFPVWHGHEVRRSRGHAAPSARNQGPTRLHHRLHG